MFDKDFKEFAELLNSTGVEYLLVGGYAHAAHGHPRYTDDLDIWFAPTATNVNRLLRALDLFGFGSIGLTEADFMRSETVVQLGFPPTRIDLFTFIDGVRFEECHPRRDSGSFPGKYFLPTRHVAGAALPLARADQQQAA